MKNHLDIFNDIFKKEKIHAFEKMNYDIYKINLYIRILDKFKYNNLHSYIDNDGELVCEFTTKKKLNKIEEIDTIHFNNSKYNIHLKKEDKKYIMKII